MTPANPDDEAMRLADLADDCSLNEEATIEIAAHLRRLVEEKREANEGRVAKIVECASLRQENERMRRGLEQIVQDSDTKTAVMLGVQIVGRIHRTAKATLTPAPAVETKPTEKRP